MKKCPFCNTVHNDNFYYCTKCGGMLTSFVENKVCHCCGREYPSNFTICNFCGINLLPATRAYRVMSQRFIVQDGTAYLNQWPNFPNPNWKDQIREIHLPSSLVSINESLLFQLPKLERIFIPNGMGWKFANMLPKLWQMLVCEDCSMPFGYPWIGQSFGFNNQSLVMPFGRTDICDGEYKGDRTVSGHVLIPGSVRTIGREAFANTPMSSIRFGEGVGTIGAGAFKDCKRLEYVQLPASLMRIYGGGQFGYSPFYGCTSLKKIFVPVWEAERFKAILSSIDFNLLYYLDVYYGAYPMINIKANLGIEFIK